jgi:hypothetical protein
MATDTASHARSQPEILSDLKDKIIWACCRYQFMTVVDLYNLLGCPPSLNQYRRVTAGLAGGGDLVPGHFLCKWPLPQTRWGNATRVVVPGDRSRDLLDQWGDTAEMTWNYPAKMRSYSYSFVYHNLAVTRLAICAALFCREHPPYTLAELRLWHDMQRRPPRVTLGEGGEQTSVSVIPDCWLYLQKDGRGAGLWFEIDNATEYRQNFQRRVRARLALIESEAYGEYFGTRSVLLCYAVLDKHKSPQLQQARLENLQQWTNDFLVRENREDWASKFRFAAIEYEKLYEQRDHLLTAPVWSVPGRPSPLPLLSPPPATEQTDEHNNSALEIHAHP